MGCSFVWEGAIPDPETQEMALTLFRDFFDPIRRWPALRPLPEMSARTLFSTAPATDPIANPDCRGRIEPAYPVMFRGVVPYLLEKEPSNMVRRGQFVFDRGDGGCMVSGSQLSACGTAARLTSPPVSPR